MTKTARRVLFCAVDGGAYGALAPVATHMKDEGHRVCWVTQLNSVCAKRLGAVATHIANTAHGINNTLKTIKPHVVVTGVSSGGSDMTLHLSQLAMDLKIPVAKILDFWGTGMPREKGFSPDRLCVLDEPSRAYEARMRNMLPEHIIATGAPQFDTLLNVRTLPRGVMAKYGVEKEKPFMLFVAPSSETRVREVLNLLFQVLSDVTHPIVLGTLWHPRMEKTDKWSAWLRDQLYCLSHVTHIDDEVLRKIGSTDELLATANVVVGSTSTELVKACYLRRPVVSILPQGGINHSEVLLARDIHELPTSACGASLHTENFSQLFDCYFDFREGGVRWVRRSQAMLEAQKANYRLDGKNTKRAVSVVESFF